uniref:Lymphoid-restricted membrane protein n=1 Tax=Hucho hucho TaxID=62062 RepID=A0A4W5MLR9_9TELE
MDLGVTDRQRHNPVDSICRKLQTIQRHDREVNPSSPFQIPKFTSSSHDSPQSGLPRNLEVILKKREREGLLTPKGSPQLPRSSRCPNSTPVNPTMNPPTPVNATFSNPGEWRGTGVGVGLGGQGRGWQRNCSTPTVQTGDMFFSFSHGPQFTQPEAGTGSDGSERHRTPSLSHTHTPAHSLLSYNLNFCSSDSTANLLQSELPYPALVVKRLSMGDGAMSSENQQEMMAEVSLICEEDLLDTIFHACDIQRRGKVYVSCIVDYLRHTTSRGSEDSGLEDLCNMLDPEHKDVSIDLDTYHAIMNEWIDDCRKNGYWSCFLCPPNSKRSVLLNMTSSSLETFGGEVSRADLETSDLVFCVADLQFSNQKLQQEVRTLKQTVETMEDHNQKLAEENEELKSQARLGQQLAQKEKMLKDEVEEMKMSLSCTEEGRAMASAQSKHMVYIYTHTIFTNIKVTMEMDDLQKRMIELCDLNAELQVGPHNCCWDDVLFVSFSFGLMHSRSLSLVPSLSLPRCPSCSAGLSLSVAYRLNQSTSGSLQTELALAQTPPEGAECVSPLSFASALDETLDREVLLLLQGPTPDQMSLEFKSLINKLKRDFKDEGLSILSTLRGLIHHYGGPGASKDPRLQSELDQRRTEWSLSLEQLDQYTDSLEKELIKMASNIRRSRTEILHLLVRVQEQENQKQQLREELDQLNTPGDSREASCQTPDEDPQVGWREGRGRQDSSEASCETPDPDDPQVGLIERRETWGKRWCPLCGAKLPECFGPEDAHQQAVDTEERPLPPSHSSLSGKTNSLSITLSLFLPSDQSFSLCTMQSLTHSSLQLHLSPNDKEIETEFQRLSLGFKCDLFTLEKRLRLEERSRDLAEENVRREVSSCQGLLQALAPLCEDDNQSMEIIQRLQKNLDILIQSMTRVSSRSEMLGAIHQESRTGKAVEVMIQHVENLRRMYTKEHAELTELRENMLQNERSFGSHSGGTHSDDFRGKKQSGSTYYKVGQFRLTRRVSIAAIPRSGGGGGPMHYDTPNKAQDTTEAERLTRRSPWNVTGKSTARPPLKRFVSSGAWVETDEPSPILAEQAAAAPCSGYSSRPASAASGSRGLWLWLALVVVLAGLLALLASLVLQPAVDAAPVGTGDSWVTIQQLLWPYTGLRHNGQPPV